MPKTSARDPLAFTPEGDPVPAFTPWVPERRRANGWSSYDQRLFIRELARSGSVKAAARCVGKTPRSAYALRDKLGAQSFSVAWDRASRAGLERTRERIMHRFEDGEWVPRFYHGRRIGTEHRWNAGPLIAVLNSLSRKPTGDPDDITREYNELEEYRMRLENWEGSIRCRLGLAEWKAGDEERDEAEAYHRALERERKAMRKKEMQRRAREQIAQETMTAEEELARFERRNAEYPYYFGVAPRIDSKAARED